jgi:excisionase family DNA binding protein
MTAETPPLTEEGRREFILAAVAAGQSYAEVGEALGVTKQRVGQLVKRYGRPTVHRDYLTPQEVADLLGLIEQTVRRAAERLGLRPPPGRRWRLSMADVEAITAVYCGLCVICGEPFRSSFPGTLTCAVHRGLRDSIPRSEYARRLREEGFQDWNSFERTLRLARAAADAGEADFIPFCEAVSLSRLTQMQFVWLRLRGALQTRPHPTDIHPVTNEPVNLYSRSQALAIGEAVLAERRAASCRA